MAGRIRGMVSFLTALFLVAALAAPAAATPPKGGNKPDKPPGQGKGKGGGKTTAWEDDFTGTMLDSRWAVASGAAPGYIKDTHRGFYDPTNVSLSGSILTLRLTQEQGPVDSIPAGYVSRGALVFTQKKYGYGTYEWRMRMTSTAAHPAGMGTPVSGSVSAGFVYVNNSETEIDFEYGGHVLAPNDPDDIWADHLLYLVNWHNTDPSTGPFDSHATFSTVEVIALNSMFHTFTFVWEPGRITFSVNGEVKWVHTTDVPEAPAHFMINHWGTHNPRWGGEATPGVERFFHIDWVRYTPLP